MTKQINISGVWSTSNLNQLSQELERIGITRTPVLLDSLRAQTSSKNLKPKKFKSKGFDESIKESY